MPHMSLNDQTQEPAKHLRGEKILDHRLCHLSLSTYCTSTLFLLPFSLMHREGKHRHFCHLPQGKPVNGPLILRSKDQSQPGRHVCQIKEKKMGVTMLTWRPQCMQKLLKGYKTETERMSEGSGGRREDGQMAVPALSPTPPPRGSHSLFCC